MTSTPRSGSTNLPVAIEHGYPARAERWIAAGRAVLATLPPVLWWLGAYDVAAHRELAERLLWAYLMYAWLLAGLVWHMPSPERGLQIVTHTVDLATYGVFVYLFEGQGSPFSFYFTFALVAAAIRWGWRGTLSTAAVALLLYGSITLYFLLRSGQGRPWYPWLFRMVYLGVLGVLIGYLGAYESEWRREVSRLAGWSVRFTQPGTEALRRELEHAASVLAAPRLVLAWEDEDNASAELVYWSAEQFQRARASPATVHGLVREPLRERSFFCLNVATSRPVVWYATARGVERWEGAPLSAEVGERLGARQVLAIRLRGESVSGQLLALDKRRLTADDLVLGQIVARELVRELEHAVLTQRLRQAAVNEERLRLAGDLHDGLLQSLAAASLQLQAARQKLAQRRPEALDDLDRAQQLLAAEQHDLRFLIEALRPRSARPAAAPASLTQRLEGLARTVEQVWRVRVHLAAPELANGWSADAQHELYRIVQEAVINAARHAGGSAVWVTVRPENGGVQVQVADDGHGFPFQGRRPHAALAAEQAGPVSLRQRVERLGGSLTITSTPSGSVVEVQLPGQFMEA